MRACHSPGSGTLGAHASTCLSEQSAWFTVRAASKMRPRRAAPCVWASFNWVKQVDLGTAVEQQKRLTEIVDTRQLVVKTAALEEAIDDWTPSELRRVQSAHAALILASEGGLSLSRATPMPPS